MKSILFALLLFVVSCKKDNVAPVNNPPSNTASISISINTTFTNHDSISYYFKTNGQQIFKGYFKNTNQTFNYTFLVNDTSDVMNVGLNATNPAYPCDSIRCKITVNGKQIYSQNTVESIFTNFSY